MIRFRHLFTLSVLGALIFPFHSSAAKFDDGMRRILDNYVKVQTALAADSTTEIGALVKQIQTETKALKKQAAGDQKDLIAKIESSSTALGSAKDIRGARETFKQLSAAMVTWVKKAKPAGLKIASCPMAQAQWIQKEGTIANPYYGKEMLECGEFE